MRHAPVELVPLRQPSRLASGREVLVLLLYVAVVRDRGPCREVQPRRARGAVTASVVGERIRSARRAADAGEAHDGTAQQRRKHGAAVTSPPPTHPPHIHPFFPPLAAQRSAARVHYGTPVVAALLSG